MICFPNILITIIKVKGAFSIAFSGPALAQGGGPVSSGDPSRAVGARRAVQLGCENLGIRHPPPWIGSLPSGKLTKNY